MKTITFLNNKGGVGKTASISAIGHMMAANYGKSVLLVDMDPQANTSQLFGFDGNSGEYSLKDVLQGKVYPIKNTVEDILENTEKDIYDCIYQTDYEGLDIIPSFITLSNVENQLIGNVNEPQQFRLYKQLKKVQDKYDYCLIDCGPSVSLLNINALAASDVAYIPSRCDRNSRIGIANILRLIKTVQGFSQKNLSFGGCFLVQYNERKKICQEAWEDCRDALREKLIPITIPTSTKVEQTCTVKKPLQVIDPSGKATQKYLELTEYIINEGKCC